MAGTEWTPVPLQALEADEMEQVTLYINASNKQDRKLAKRYAEEKLSPRFEGTEEMQSGMALRLNWNKSVLMYGFVEPDAAAEDDYPDLPPRPQTADKTVKTTGFKSPIPVAVPVVFMDDTLVAAYRQTYSTSTDEDGDELGEANNPDEQIWLIHLAAKKVYPDLTGDDFEQKVIEAMYDVEVRQKLFLDRDAIGLKRDPIKTPLGLSVAGKKNIRVVS
jgi:hypothetical protein